MPDDVSVLVLEDGKVTARVPLPRDGSALRIGSRAEADLVIDDPAVSRDHAELRRTGDEIEVKDLHSKNGTWVGESRIETVRLRPPAQLRVGMATIRIVATADEPEVARFGSMVATSRAMRDVFAMLRRVADHDAPVLVLGETGTGKELVARGLHLESRRAAEPFVVVDLGALSTGVVESELFGHVRGAFTGAVTERAGAFEAAGTGTVFLDELGEMPLELQPRLLRVLESGDTKRVGANRYHTNHARIVAATHRDLRAEVADRSFREDLYHRLAVVVITLPPLRDRPEDIPLLVDLVVGDRAHVPHATLQALAAHDWPGNVRQLRHVLERALILTPDGTITSELLGVGEPGPSHPAIEPFKEAKQRLVDAWEHDYVVELVARSNGNLSDAARRAGIARGHLHRLLRKHEIGPAEPDDHHDPE